MVKSTLERELKLRAAVGFALPPLPGRPIATRHLSSTYHDTEDHRLASIGVTLRYRAENGSGAWQLKLPAQAARTELEVEGPPDTVPEELLDLVFAPLGGCPLRPVATLETVRNGIVVTRDNRDVAEVVQDQVVVHAGSEAVRAFDELEVELLDGDEADLEQLRDTLEQAGAQNGDQRPKLLQALGLHRPAAPKVDPSDPPFRQLTAMLRAQLRAILINDPGTRLGTDPEALHQHRVAVRRLRALLRAARPMLDRDWVSEVRGELKWVGAALGEVRDLDVLLEHLEREAAGLPHADMEAFAPLFAVLAQRRQGARERMLAALRQERYVELLDRLERELPEPPRDASAAEVHPAELARTEFRRLRKRMRALTKDSPDEQLHEARIAVKRARYSAELAAPSSGDRMTKLVSAYKDLQDVLGDHQDAAVAEAAVREVALGTGRKPGALAAGMIVERQRGRRADARLALPDSWRAVKRRGRRAFR
jgi:CHAD domain-containing protein